MENVSLDHKCPSCGANIKFNPVSQKWDCEYCGASYELNTFQKETQEKDKKEKREKSENITSTNYNEYSCKNCGAVIITDENTSATHCVYCGNTAIMKDRLKGEFQPDKMIPFKTTKEDAIYEFQKLIAKKRFAPKEFSAKENIEKISGVYIPFWLFDGKTEGGINATGKKIRCHRRGDYDITETTYYKCHREGNEEYIDVPVDGSTKFDDNIMDSIEPYDYSEFVEFNSSYLAGFLAEKYDQTSKDVNARAIERVKNTLIENLRSDIRGYTEVTVDSSNINVESGDVEYALLPVWMMNINYKEKTHVFAMNGQTKKCVGNIPIDYSRALRKSFAVFAGITAIAFLISLLIGGVV